MNTKITDAKWHYVQELKAAAFNLRYCLCQLKVLHLTQSSFDSNLFIGKYATAYKKPNRSS